MHTRLAVIICAGFTSALCCTACSRAAPLPPTHALPPVPAASTPESMTVSDNPLLVESSLPYHYPPFDRIEAAHFEPAFELGMQEQRREVAAIAADPEVPTFDNTIVALERSGELLERAEAVFSNLVQSNTTPALDALEAKLAPRLAAHADALYLDAALFDRVNGLYEQRETMELAPEAVQLLERYTTRFIRAGAKLTEAQKQQLKRMNEKLATLTTRFRQTVLEGANASAVVVGSASELEGLSKQRKSIAKRAAEERGLSGKYLIALVNTTTQPVLSQLENRALRQRVYQASISRGLPQGSDEKHVTTGLIAEIAALRAERAALLGYPNHAAYVLADETAKTPEAVNAMLARLVPSAVENARAEAREIQQQIDAEAKRAGTEPFALRPWDWDFYAERVRKLKFDFDEAEVRPYFEIDRVLRQGVLFAAEQLYGLSFQERHDLPVYHPDVRVFEVFDKDGSPLGLCLFDWFARPNKRGGAWMSDFVRQSQLLSRRPVVATNLNVPKPPPGQPALMTFDEVNTAFHELGHALHGLLSNVRYPTLSGTAVPTDFVEYPSQFNEMWATDETVLTNYARHHETGTSMPESLLSKVVATRLFNQGYETTEYLAAALLDQAYHQMAQGSTPAAPEIEAFEATALKAAEVDVEVVPPRYRSGYFSHVFSDPIGYSAGYYSYIWSEVLARDTERWFEEHGGLSRKSGDLFREKVLSRGYTRDPLAMFEDFTGGPPDVKPLLEARGLVAPAQ